MEKIKKLCVCSFYMNTLNTEMYLFIYKTLA